MTDQYKIRFNINDRVRVKLTDFGRTKHRGMYDQILDKYVPPTEDADGWSEWQLWELMSTFGSIMWIGGQVPFETEIEFITKTLPEIKP